MENLKGLLRFDSDNTFTVSRNVSLENTPIDCILHKDDGSIIAIHVEFDADGIPTEATVFVGDMDSGAVYSGTLTEE